MPTNPNVAPLFNSFSPLLAQLADAQDTALALEEFALGQPQAARALDLGFGFAPIPAISFTTADSLLTLARGRCRLLAGLLPIYPQRAIDITSGMGASKISGAFAFGAVHLALDSGNDLTLEVVYSGAAGNPLYLSRDVDSAIALSWLLRGDIPTSASAFSAHVPILKFLLDIDVYDPSNPANTRIQAHIIDLRRERGFGGFDEEKMVPLTLATLAFFTNISQDIADMGAALYNCMTVGAMLPY